MNLYQGKFDFHDKIHRNNYNNIFDAFITVFQLMTLEQWQHVLHLTMRTNVLSAINVVYLISWIFVGNYVLLNLFLAILFDGFHGGDQKSFQVIIEDREIHELRQFTNIQKEKEKDK